MTMVLATGNAGDGRNIAVFIDYENVYKTLLCQKSNIIRHGFFERIRQWCGEHGGRIVKLAVYCNFDNADLHQSFHQSLLQSYGVETVHTSNQGKNYADLQITIDVLNSMYINSNIDEFMIMSNDKDMTPLLNTIRMNKRKVTVITVGEKYNHSICMFADEHIKYEDIVAISCGELLIDKMQNEVWEKTNEFMIEKCNTCLNEGQRWSYGLDYCIDNLVKHHKLMRYEVANMLKAFASEGKIVFYTYSHKGQSYIGLMPSIKKEEFIARKIMTANDFINNYDIDSRVAREYSQYEPQNG